MPISAEFEEATDQIMINAPIRYKELMNSIPGCHWDSKRNLWRLPVSWSACLAIRSVFRDDLEIGPALTEWAVEERARRVDPAMAVRDVIDMEEGDEDLFPHQRAGVKFLATARRALLADEPGLGKTAQAIRAMKKLHDEGEKVFPALVVCPNTLKRNWEREFEKWWPGVNVQIIGGTAVQRRKQFDSVLNPQEDQPTVHVLVTNWESLRSHSRLADYGSVARVKCPDHGGVDQKITAARCEEHERELNQIDFKTVVADEIHRSKDPRSKQTRALWGATGDADFRFALTGTPIANNVVDLWPILHWLDPREWPSKTRWMTRMVDVLYNAFGGMVVTGLKSGVSQEFYASINPRMRRMLKEVVLPWLPEILYERRDVEMSTKQRKAYEQMRDEMIAELESGEYVTVTNNMTQTLRLLQFASAFATNVTDPETGEVKTLLSDPSAKIDAFMNDIENGDFGDDSVAVSSVSRQLIDLLAARLDKAKIPYGLITGEVTTDQRDRAIEAFQAGHTKFILFTAQAGGVGVTLTKARWLVRLQRPWSLVDDTQVRDRVHRIGSEIHDSIVVLDYITEGTVEERVLEVLEKKGKNFEEVVRDKDQLLNILKSEKVKK